MHRFNAANPDEKDVSIASVRRKLKRMKARKVKRVHVQQFSPGNQHARFVMACENVKNRWVNHFDLDEKWFYVVSRMGGCGCVRPA